FRARAAGYGVEEGKLAIVGFSAGGYLASISAVTRSMPEFESACDDKMADKQRPDIDVAVVWYGIHDFNKLSPMSGNVMDTVLFSKVSDKKSFKKKVSPVTYAEKAPPMLLLHGTVDSLVPVSQSHEMCDAVKAAGGECKMVEFPNSEHSFKNVKTGTDDDFKAALAETGEWLDKHFAK
ncbi:MAG TPA: prolyl oligopeptidase family serine peptidase, partial [bacterium]|nr:prolyl oligopeptidase family serine peptidase [bacterium]